MGLARSRLQPSSTTEEHIHHHFSQGVAQSRTGETEPAIRNLERAIELDPSLEDAYFLLAQIYANKDQPAMRRRTLERYLRFMPQSISALEALKGSSLSGH